MTRPRSIAVRITGLCLLVAGVVAIVGGLVSARLVVSTAREVTRQTLSDQADVIAAQIAESPAGLRRIVEILRGQEIEPVLLRPNGAIAGATETAKRAAIQAGLADPGRRSGDPGAAGTGDGGTSGAGGGDGSGTVEVGGRTLLVEIRRLDDGGAIALVRDAETARGIGRKLIGNIALALGIGLVVAGAAGLVLARLLARPLTRTAAVATAMGRGRRDVRVPVEGPREVAQVAASVNGLADALEHTERGQREFLLSVSHELRTPLTAVRGFAESLADGVVTDPAEVTSAGRIIESEAARLNRLVNDLLDLARLGTDDFRVENVPVDLSVVFDHAAKVWSARCGEAGVMFRLDTEERPVRLETDPRRVRQVLDGLLENALRVTPRGQPIVVTLRELPDSVLFGVRDGGPGLTEEDLAVVFEPKVLNARYAGTRPGGTGIGLALVHGLVTRLGGRIWAAKAPEGGVMFGIKLPFSPPNLRRV